MEQIHLTACFKIQAGKKESFKDIAAQCVEAVRKNEEGALRYQWFYAADQTECKVLETYRDTEAVFAHMQNVGPLLQKLLEISTVSGEVYGHITEPLRKGFEGLDISYYEYETGL
jgi:quinol monooxygenase YgiN